MKAVALILAFIMTMLATSAYIGFIYLAQTGHVVGDVGWIYWLGGLGVLCAWVWLSEIIVAILQNEVQRHE